MTSSPDFQKAEPYTLESLCRLYDQWMADGANLKKAKKYTKVVHPLLLTGNKNKRILELVNNSWSTYTAYTTSTIQFVNRYLPKINICRVSYQRQHRLEGSACNKLLKNIDSFELFFQESNLRVPAAKYIKVLRDF